MSQQGKAGIFFLAVLALVLVLYLLFSAKNETIKFDQNLTIQETKELEAVNDLEKISLAEIETNYKSNLKKVLDDFENKISSRGAQLHDETSQPATASSSADGEELELIIDDLSELKVSVMGLTVPEIFRDFHFSLVKRLSETKEAIRNESEFDKDEILAIIENAREKNYWLE